jgi:hypothetical protein
MNNAADIAARIWEFAGGDWISAMLVAVVALLVIAIILMLLYFALDSWFLPRIRGIGKIVDKTFTPSHVVMVSVLDVVTRTFKQKPVPVPDNWSLCVEVDGQRDSISVKQAEFNSFAIDSFVSVEYAKGRFFGSLNLYGVYHK